MIFSMVLGAKMVRSSNHHSLLEQGFIGSGVLVDEEHLKPEVSGEEEEDEDDDSRWKQVLQEYHHTRCLLAPQNATSDHI